MSEQLSKESLEDLLVAVLQLRTESGMLTNLMPVDVLQPWVLEQLPSNKNSGDFPPPAPV